MAIPGIFGGQSPFGPSGGISTPNTPTSNGQQGPPTIRRGSQGLYVAYCQNLLNARLTQSPLWVDGMFGADTDQRVRFFQATRGLEVDGIVGPITWSALEAGPPPIKRRPAIAPASQPFVSGGF